MPTVAEVCVRSLELLQTLIDCLRKAPVKEIEMILIFNTSVFLKVKSPLS